MSIYKLVKKYEAGGDPAAVSDACGGGDLGGISYGIHQLSSNAGSVQSFLEFACKYENDALANYGRVLSELKINGQAFQDEWRRIGTVDPTGFAELQNAYAKEVYYDQAAELLRNAGYEIETKSEAMKAVLFSRSVQYNAGNIVELYTKACQTLGHPTLSYVNNKYFDKLMIRAIYEFLEKECDDAYDAGGGNYHSPLDWANGSYDVVKYGLHDRFINEKNDALEMLEEEN